MTSEGKVALRLKFEKDVEYLAKRKTSVLTVPKLQRLEARGSDVSKDEKPPVAHPDPKLTILSPPCCADGHESNDGFLNAIDLTTNY